MVSFRESVSAFAHCQDCAFAFPTPAWTTGVVRDKIKNRKSAICFSVQIIRGPSSHVALVELFTSEGCSSCPPADRWLSGLTQDKRLWRDIVPLAFHVDYWDQLGWRDRFSSAANTDRQRRLAAAGNANGVYTPGFFFDANEWRGFFRSAPLPSTHIASPGPLTISIGGDSAVVSYQGDAAANGASSRPETPASTMEAVR